MCTVYLYGCICFKIFYERKNYNQRFESFVILYKEILDFFPYYIFSLFQFCLNVQQSLRMVIFSTGVLLHVQ